MSSEPTKLRGKYKISIKNFEKINKISSGGFGEVYKVRDKESGKIYAAKVIKHNNDKSIYKKLINREISIMMKISHPTLIQFYGYSLTDFDEKENVTILMEYLEKGSLYNLLRQIRLSQADPKFDNTNRQIILIGIAYGMSYLHKHHIIHRDLKSVNVLLDNEFKPRIIDFGLSKFYHKDEKQTNEFIMQNSIYMAPETMKKNICNEKIDVYSFGILMYEVVTDQIPFEDFRHMTYYQFQNKVIEENYRPEFSFEIKEGIKKLIESCWSKDPNERPTFEQIFHKLAYSENDYYIDVYEENETENEYDVYKYYLDGVDQDAVLDYIDEISDVSPFDEMNNKFNEMNKKIDELQKSTEKYKMQISQLVKAYKSQSKNINALKDGHNNIAQKFKASYKEQNDQMQKLKEENESQSNQIQKLKTENKEQNNQMQNIKDENESQSNQIQKLKTENKEQNNQMQNIKDENESQNNQIKKLKTEIKEQNNLIQKLKGENELQNNQIQKLKTENKEQSNQIRKLKDENEALSKQNFNIERIITIAGFNGLSMASQMMLIPKIINDNNQQKIVDYLNNFLNFLKFLNNNKVDDERCYIQIHSQNDNQILYNLEYNDEIHILNDAVEAFMQKGEFKSDDFLNQIKPFKTVFIDIQYPSCSFDFIYPNILKIKEALKNEHNIEIGICINKMNSTGKILSNNEIINYISIDPTITSIGEHVFDGCSSLTQISIPSSVTSIGDFAFYGCSSLAQISIPSSVISIGKSAFYGCSSLTQIMIPSSVTEIGFDVFYKCTSLMQITIPSSITSIGLGSFHDCSSLMQISIPSSVKAIGSDAFYGCSSLLQLIIPSQVSVIKCNAFEKCSSLTQIVIPSSVTSIEKYVFRSCSSLKQIAIPSSVTSIEDNAFEFCLSLAQISIPSTVNEIGNYAFSGCISLQQIFIPSSVTSIGNGAFKGCSSLTQISIPSSVASFGYSAFDGCINLDKISILSCQKKIIRLFRRQIACFKN